MERSVECNSNSKQIATRTERSSTYIGFGGNANLNTSASASMI